jgi:hypothetical protein
MLHFGFVKQEFPACMASLKGLNWPRTIIAEEYKRSKIPASG